MADTNTSRLKTEARLFGRSLLGRQIDEASVRLYVAALRARPGRPSKSDQRLLDFAVRHPHMIGVLDAGSALLLPNTELRRRLFILFSILETRPAYAAFFLPARHTFWHVVGVGLQALQAVCKMALGVVLVKMVAR